MNTLKFKLKRQNVFFFCNLVPKVYLKKLVSPHVPSDKCNLFYLYYVFIYFFPLHVIFWGVIRTWYIV